MITPSNTIKIRSDINANAVKAIFKRAIIMMRAFLIAGGAGVAAMIAALIAVMIKETAGEDILFALLLCFGAILGAGIGLKIIVGKNIKQTIIENAANEYEFFADCIHASVIKRDEVVTASKIYYSQVTKLKEAGKYVLIYISKTTALPVLKNDLTEVELNTIYGMLNLPHGEQTVELPAYTEK